MLLITTAHYTFLEARVPEVTKNLFYVLPIRRSQIPIFLGSSSWTIKIGDIVEETTKLETEINV